MISNQKNKSVEGLSYAMIFSWFAGDAFKTTYFIMEVLFVLGFQKQPFQFIMCGSVQLLVDVIILWQIYVFKDKIYKNFIKVDDQ
jgi:hypothetical protein